MAKTRTRAESFAGTSTGGATIKPPALYPSDDAPFLEWAVMRDPFGNEFCFVKWPLTPSP